MSNKVGIVRTNSYDIEEVRLGVKSLFDQLGYNSENPLGEIIKPGMKVFIKPNWVASRWRESCPHKDDIYCVITHPSVIEVIADYVDIALQGKGEIVIGDNPSIDADFEELMQLTNIKRLESKYKVPCTIMDLRPLVCKSLEDYGDKEKMVPQQGDPLGKTEINLGSQSLFAKVNSKLFRGVFKQREETIKSHSGNNQLYSFSKTLYDADVYISIPKMKTHHKVGTTLNLKGLVGSIAVKNQLVHWRVGFPLIGGDEYPSFWHWIKGCFSKVKERGAWHGNDTIWRMVVDLYQCMLLKERRYFTVVDGILGGEGKGPFCPNSKESKTLVGGEDLLLVDIVTSRLMGFSPYKIPYLNYFINTKKMNLKDIEICSTDYDNLSFFDNTDPYLDFNPPEKWRDITVKD